MLRKKVQMFAQIVGFVTVGLLAVYGLATILSRGSLAWAAGDETASAKAPQELLLTSAADGTVLGLLN